MSQQISPGLSVLSSQTQMDPDELSPPPIHLSTRFMASGMLLTKSSLLSFENAASWTIWDDPLTVMESGWPWHGPG